MNPVPPFLKKKKLILFLILCIIIIILGIRSLFFTNKEPELLTVKVTRGNIEETVLATGTLKPSTLVAVGAQVSGRITSLNVELGQKIKKGDLVAEIDSVTQTNNLKIAEANLAMAIAQKQEKEAALAKAQSDYNREKITFSKNASSKASFEATEQNLKAAQAQLDYINAQIKEREVSVSSAQVNLGYTRITAPTNGTVLSKVVQEGQTVNSVQSAPTIVILGNIDTMTVRGEISEADIVKVKTGQKVYFTILGDQTRRYNAKLEFIEPAPEAIKTDSAISPSSSSTSISQNAIYYIGVFSVPNEDQSLKTYMTAQISIVLGSAENALLIPVSALGKAEKDGSYNLEVLEKDGSISRKKVTIGLNNKVMAEVLSGLEEGDKVISGRLEAGAKSDPTQMRRPRRLGM